MPLSDRPWGPVTPAANSATQAALNTQEFGSSSTSGPLPVSQSLTSSAETVILAANSTAALSTGVHPDTNIEQTVFDLYASGILSTTASGTVNVALYAGNSTTIGSNTKLGAAGATTQNGSTTPNVAAFFVHARLIFDSTSGVLAGDVEFYINKTKVASVTLSNFPSGYSNTGTLPTFSLTATSSGAAPSTPTTINVQKFSVG